MAAGVAPGRVCLPILNIIISVLLMKLWDTEEARIDMSQASLFIEFSLCTSLYDSSSKNDCVR